MKVEEIKYFIFGMTYFWTVPNILKDEFGYIRIFGTFLGKAPKYGYTVSAVRWDTYFLVNQLGHRQTQALIRTYYIIIIKGDEDKEEEVKKAQSALPPPFDNDDMIGSNQYLCLPKAELKTKNSTKRQLCCRLVEFLVFNSIH